MYCYRLYSFLGCFGRYLFNVYNMFGTFDASTRPKSAKVVDGPKPETKAIQFTPTETERITVGGHQFAYLMHAMYSSHDLTFTTSYKISGLPASGKSKRWCFFSMLEFNSKHTYFSIGLNIRIGTGGSVEGESTG